MGASYPDTATNTTIMDQWKYDDRVTMSLSIELIIGRAMRVCVNVTNMECRMLVLVAFYSCNGQMLETTLSSL